MSNNKGWMKNDDGMGYVVAKSLDEINPRKIAEDGVKEALSKIGGKINSIRKL